MYTEFIKKRVFSTLFVCHDGGVPKIQLSTFLVKTLCTQTMFPMLVCMHRDPGDTTSKVSCCVEPPYCFKNSGFDASVRVPVALPLKMSLPENETTPLSS